MYVSSPYIWSVMWCPLDSVTICCFVHFTIGPSYFLIGFTVCPWVLIDFVTFGPKLHLKVQVARKLLENFYNFGGDSSPRPSDFQASTVPLCCACLVLGTFFGQYMPAVLLLPVFGLPMAYGLHPSHFDCLLREGSQVTPMDVTTAGPRIGRDAPYVPEVDKLFVHRWTSCAWTLQLLDISTIY